MFDDEVVKDSPRVVVGRNTAYQLIGKAIGGGATLLITIILARQFGAAEFGDYIKIITFVGFFFLFVDFGLNAIYLQLESTPGSRRIPSPILGSLFSLRMLGSAVLMLSAGICLIILPIGTGSGYTGPVRFGILLFAPAIFFQSIITTSNAVFQKNLRYNFATLSIAAGSAVALGVLFFLLVYVPTIGGATAGVVAGLAGSIVTAASSIWLLRRLTPLSLAHPSAAYTHLLVPAFPLGLTLVSNVLYAHADSVILTVYRSTAEVGTYGMAYKIFETILVLPTFYMNALYPFLVRSRATADEVMRLVKKSFRVLLGLSLVITVVIWMCAPLLANIRPEFTQSIYYLRVLGLSLPFFFLSSLTMWVLISMKKQWMLAGIYAVAMVLNILGNVLFIPDFGAQAAAWITVVSEGMILAVSGGVLLRYIRMNKQ